MPVDIIAALIAGTGVAALTNSIMNVAHDKQIKKVFEDAALNKHKTIEEMQEKRNLVGSSSKTKAISVFTNSAYSKYLVDKAEEETSKAKKETKKAQKVAIATAEQAKHSIEKSEKEKQHLQEEVQVLKRRLSQMTQSGEYKEDQFTREDEEHTDKVPLLNGLPLSPKTLFRQIISPTKSRLSGEEEGTPLSPKSFSFFSEGERSKSPVKSRPPSGNEYSDGFISPKSYSRRSSQDDHRTSDIDNWLNENNNQSSITYSTSTSSSTTTSKNSSMFGFGGRRNSSDGDNKILLSPKSERIELPLKSRPASGEGNHPLSSKSHSRNSSQDKDNSSSSSSDYELPSSPPATKNFSFFRRKSTDSVEENTNPISPKHSSSFFRRHSTDHTIEKEHDLLHPSSIGEQDTKIQSPSPSKGFSIFGNRSRRNSSDSEGENNKSPLLKSTDSPQSSSSASSPYPLRHNDSEKTAKRNSQEDRKNPSMPTIDESAEPQAQTVSLSSSPTEITSCIISPKSSNNSKTAQPAKKAIFGNLSINIGGFSLDSDSEPTLKTPKTPSSKNHKIPDQEISIMPTVDGNKTPKTPKTPKGSGFSLFAKKTHEKESHSAKFLEKAGKSSNDDAKQLSLTSSQQAAGSDINKSNTVSTGGSSLLTSNSDDHTLPNEQNAAHIESNVIGDSSTL